MIDWAAEMEQDFEFYTVDPISWANKKKLDSVRSCTIKFDASKDTLGSASFDADNLSGENYVRAYLVAIQNGIEEKFPLGTFMVQTPSLKFDGISKTASYECYTPLIELKEKDVPVGYYIAKGTNILDEAYKLASDHMRGPVVDGASDVTIYKNFVAESNDTWLSYLTDFLSNAKYTFGLDELGRTLFMPDQNIESLQPVWTYRDDNSSIIQPDITVKEDFYSVPNVVEVVYTSSSITYYAEAVNDDPNSITSTVNRGRRIVKRVTNPSLTGTPMQYMVDNYATDTLKSESVIKAQLNYTHGYNQVRVGDCVMLDYKLAGIDRVKAKVTSQSIKCQAGCPVTETAEFSLKLWG